MALTKISRGLLNTGVSDSSDANAITISSAEKVTVANSLNAPTSIQTPLIEFTDGDDAIAIADGGAVTMAKVGAIGATTAGTGAFTTLTTSSNLTVGGNLTVTGTSTVVDTVTMNAQNAVIFEGATADNYETTLSIVDPTADHTQYLINQDGYIPVLAAVSTTAITSTPAELNILDGVTTTAAELNLIDGGTARGTDALASGDGILINDAGTMKMTDVDTVKTFMGTTTEEIQDIVGAMFTSNTETGIAATYEDGDGTIDLVVGTLNQNTTGTAATVTGAAQTAITSLGTLTALTVDDITIDGSTISDAGTFTIDVGGNIDFDADGGEWRFKDAGTLIGQLYNGGGGSFYINSTVSDKDLIFQGNDGGSTITALTLDMSNSGNAIFNYGVETKGYVSLTTASNKSVQIESATSNKSFLSAWQDVAMFGINRDPASGSIAQSGRAAATIKLASNDADSNMVFQTTATNNAEPTTRMTIDKNGQVGIGTTGPAGKLHIQDTSATSVGILLTNSNNTTGAYSDLKWCYSSGDQSYGSGLRFKQLNTTHGGQLEFFTDNTSGTYTQRMTLTEDGNLGIGITSPATTLHLDASGGAVMRLQRTSSNATNKLELSHDGTDGTITSTNNLLLGSRVGINRTPAVTNSKLEVGGADNVPLINVEASGATAGFGIGSSKGKFYYGTSEACSFAVGDFTAGNIRLNGTSSDSQIEAGNVHFKVGAGIWMSGSSSLDLQLQVPVTGVGVSTAAKLDAPTGDWYTNDGSVSSLSDSRLKKDITTLTDGMDIVKQLRPVTFKYDDTSLENDGSKTLGAANTTTRYGFVAQEVEAVASHYVTTREGKVKGETVSDLKSTSMTRMIPMLVKAIQELEEKLNIREGELEQRVHEIEQRLI